MELVRVPIKSREEQKNDKIIAIKKKEESEEEIELRTISEIKEEIKRILQDIDDDRLEKLVKILYNVAKEKVSDEESRKLVAIDKMWRGARYIEGYLKDNFRVEKELKTDGNPIVLIVKVYY